MVVGCNGRWVVILGRFLLSRFGFDDLYGFVKGFDDIYGFIYGFDEFGI